MFQEVNSVRVSASRARTVHHVGQELEDEALQLKFELEGDRENLVK